MYFEKKLSEILVKPSIIIIIIVVPAFLTRTCSVMIVNSAVTRR